MCSEPAAKSPLSVVVPAQRPLPTTCPPWPDLFRPPTSSPSAPSSGRRRGWPGQARPRVWSTGVAIANCIGDCASRHAQRICSTNLSYGLKSLPGPGAVHAGRGDRVVGAVGLDQLQTPFKVAGLDRPDKGVDDQPRGRPAGLPARPLANPRAGSAPLFRLFYQVEIRHRQLRRYRGRLARRDHAAGERRGNRLHRGGDVVGLQPTGSARGGTLDRRQDELHRMFAAGCVRGRAASRSDRRQAPARRPCGSTPRPLRQACRGGDCRLVAAADPAAGGIARPALFERPLAHPPRRF